MILVSKLETQLHVPSRMKQVIRLVMKLVSKLVMKLVSTL